MFAGFGPTELIIVLVIVLLIFGPKRLPGLGKQLGNGMREFKDSITSKHDADEDDDDDRAAEHRTAGALERPAAEPVRGPARGAETPTADAVPRERTPQS